MIVCYGDSITAGYGASYGYPERLQSTLNKLGYHYLVKNEGTNGATTKDALAGLPSILRMRPDIVIVDFGGNDAYFHFPVEQTRQNLETILGRLEEAHAKVILAGMSLPPEYGADYIRAFEKMYSDEAAKHGVAFIPDVYKDMMHVPGALQGDGIHPTAKGADLLAADVLATLKPILNEETSSTRTP